MDTLTEQEGALWEAAERKYFNRQQVRDIPPSQSRDARLKYRMERDMPWLLADGLVTAQRILQSG